MCGSLSAKDVAFKATEQPIDTSTAAGKAFLDMLGVFAEFETNLRRERQLKESKPPSSEGSTKAGQATIEAADIAKPRRGPGLRRSPTTTMSRSDRVLAA